MNRNCMWMVLFCISPLMAQSSAAATSEVARKVQASANARDNSWNPDDFSDAQLFAMEAWMIDIDEHTVTMSHEFDKEKQAIVRRVSYPRNSFPYKSNLTRWSSVIHSKASKALFN